MNRVLLVLFLVSSAPARAAGYVVDPSGGADATTIGAAIALASDGDTIRVAAGTYYENLDTLGKSLSFISQDGPEVTTISGGGQGVLLTINRGESVSIEGFSLTGADQAIELNQDAALSLVDVAVTQTGGSAIRVANGAELSARRLSVSRCGSEDGSGGAFYVRHGKLTLSNSTLSDNTADRGGAIYGYNANISLSGVDLLGNTAGAGGGLVLENGSLLSATSLAVEDNSASADGGGLYALDSSLILDGAQITGNTASGDGGGIYAEGALTGSDWVLAGGEGAGLRCGEALSLSGATFHGNEAESGGDGLLIEGAVATLSGLSLEGHGEALVIRGGELSLLDSQLVDNEQGLIASDLDRATVRRVRFEAGGEGASFRDSAGVVLTNSTFLGSRTAGLRASGGELSLVNVDLIRNGAGLILEAGAAAEVVNAIAIYNGGGAVVAEPGAGADVRYSDLWRNGGDDEPAPGDGNISADPLYTAFSDNGTWSDDILILGPGSPCRDAGDPSILDVDGSIADMGSYGGPEAEVEDADGNGYLDVGGDCDDTDPSIHPGAEEIWYDGVDQDCAGDDDYDRDGDGFSPAEVEGVDEVDCDDTDPAVHPGAYDSSGDGVDQNCDGSDGLVVAGEPDKDGDGYEPADGDCNDDDARVHPGAEEICLDGRDNDCDGDLDGEDSDCEAAGCRSAAPSGPGTLLLLLPLIAPLRRRGA